MESPMLPSYPEAKRRAVARNILAHALRVRRGESVTIETWSATLPWAESLVLEARALGAEPMLLLEDEDTYWSSLERVPVNHLGRIGPQEWAALKHTNAYVALLGPLDTVREERMPAPLTNRIMSNDHEWFQIVERFGVRCVRWDLGRTSEVWARRYGLDLAAWRNELVDASLVDPRTFQRDGRWLGERFRRGRELRITHPNGTDLTLELAGRAAVVDDGVIDEQDVRAGKVMTVMPSGVTSISVRESAGDGTLVANVTGVMFLEGNQTPLNGGSWTIRRGRITDYGFSGGGEAFRRAFQRLGAVAFRPGFVSVGLNPKISSIPLLFDQSLGTITFEVGRNSAMGGSTRAPHVAAYLALRGGRLEVDGTPVVDRGRIARE